MRQRSKTALPSTQSRQVFARPPSSAGDPREGESPESADDAFTAHFHGLVDLQREVEAQAAEWAERQEPGAENHTACLAVEGVRALLVRQIAALAAREAPPSPDEIACLALALHRIEVVDKRRLEGERAAAEGAATQAQRKQPSTQEMRALLGPAIKEAFHPERLGSKPWEPWPDAPAPASPTPPRRSLGQTRTTTLPPGESRKRTMWATCAERTMRAARGTRFSPKTRTKSATRRTHQRLTARELRAKKTIWATRAERSRM